MNSSKRKLPRTQAEACLQTQSLLRANELSRLCLAVLRTAAGELLSTDDIAGRVIAAKGFDVGDAILRAAVRAQVGSTVKRLHRNSEVENIGAGRASKWKLLAL